MQFSPDGLLSVNNILANVTEEVNEFDFRNMSKGWFTERIQSALAELSFDSMFVVLVDDFAIDPDTLKVSLPAGAFNLREVYVYNGTIGAPSSPPIKVWWKRNVHRILGNEYSAKIRPSVSNVYGQYVSSDMENQLYCNCTNGVIDFSVSAGSYGFARLIYNGTYIPFTEVPFIPPIFKSYIERYLVENYFRVMKGRDYRKYGVMWKDALALLNREYHEAVIRASRLDKKFADDIRQYVNSMNTNQLS